MLPTSRILSYISQHNLFGPADRLLLGVSGGKDSVLMAHLLYASGYQFGIAHCNFCLRDEESDGDEAFVRELASQLNVAFHSIKFDTVRHASSNQISTQMAARELRYAWFEQVRQEHGYHYIAVAQHKSDATETILLNLIRGTGIAGLHGILPKRDSIIRPLLFLTSEEIDTIVTQSDISFRNDSSNASVKYARNKIRHEVIPKMKQLNERLDQTFEENSQRFLEVETFLKHEVDKLRNKLFQHTGADTTEIDVELLADLNPRNLLLYELFKPYQFSETTIKDLVSAWKNQSGKMFESPSHILLLDRNLLILQKRSNAENPKITFFENMESFEWNGRKYNTSRVKPNDVKFSGNGKIAYLDADLLQFPLNLRLWNKGDYFQPLGMQGKKKISDFFIGQKLNRFEKANIGILENGNGDILWVVGFRSDNRYRVTDSTQNIFIIETSG